MLLINSKMTMPIALLCLKPSVLICFDELFIHKKYLDVLLASKQRSERYWSWQN